MPIKRNFAITVLDLDKITDMNQIIIKHANITMQSSSHMYFDTQPINSSEISEDMTFFQLDAEDEASLDKKFKELTEELDQSITEYAIRDEDTGEMLVFLKFVGKLDIKFDNIKVIKKGTYKKIDELKSFKTELGVCKGYKPNFRPIEGQPLETINNNPESIYLLCHSEENLIKLKDIISEKIMEIDSDFEIRFKQFYGTKPEYSTKFNCLNLDSSSSILQIIKNKK